MSGLRFDGYLMDGATPVNEAVVPRVVVACEWRVRPRFVLYSTFDALNQSMLVQLFNFEETSMTAFLKDCKNIVELTI